PMLDFKPPIDNPVFMALIKRFVLPLELKWGSHIEVQVVDDGIERFRRLRNQRAVVVCNHGSQYDPEVIFKFGTMVGEDFYFIGPREFCDWTMGLTVWFLQNGGFYWVVRGTADRKSSQMPRRIIAYGNRKLLICPEGEVTRQLDRVLPLRRGSARLLLEGQ